MTQEEIEKIPLRFQCHTSMEHEHTTTYSAEYKGHSFGLCVHVPFQDGEPKGREHKHYMVDGHVFKTRKKFIEYCECL